MKKSSEIKTSGSRLRISRSSSWLPALVALCLFALSGGSARASIAYGSINNFDTVNDTGVPCHGFEIELDDIRSTDITYTYDYNHYGTPKITEDTVSVPGHTNVLVRYEAVWTGSDWSAYTAVPTTNIPPTQGHAFTNPSLNFGGEHFGVGYRNQPTKVYYHWLVDSGAHTLALGPQVNVSTPTFTYNPPVAGAPAQVVAVIPAPLLPLPPTNGFEFSDATWVKAIVTTSHTNTQIELRELITPDTNNPAAKDWRNGEPDEVEVEWQLLQTDFMSGDYNPTNGVGGANGQLGGTNQNLANSDDVVTRRYEYYAYVGPYADWDTHQAMAERVAPDGIHGVGVYTNGNGDPIDLSTVEVVGKFLGAQMSAMVAAPPIGLIDHLPDGEVGVEYPTRSLVIASDTNFTATSSGDLPAGMAFDPATGWVYGTPNEAGVFMLTVTATASNNPVLTKKYPIIVAAANEVLPPHSSVDTTASPTNGGICTGDGVYTNGTTATVTAAPNAGFKFVNWTENDTVVSSASSYQFTNILNRSLVANFVAVPWLSVSMPQSNAMALTWPTNSSGFVLQQNFRLGTTNWNDVTNAVTVVGTNNQVILPPLAGNSFYRLMRP
ncbi:MAG: putative Ig domain-containing protein [Verrucomicrobia bacterium]|nr:putative Ig domain-containing protein [Verrucomicrobiota bacterium]